MGRNIQQVIEEIRTKLREIESLALGEKTVPQTGRPEDVPLPPVLNTVDFRALFLEFCAHRRRKAPGDVWTAVAASRKLAQLAKLGLTEATRWVEFTLENGFKNIQEPFQKGTFGTPTTPLARPRKCALCGVRLERSSTPTPQGEICPLCAARK